MENDEKKVFYFLKLQRDFFQRSEVRILESMSNGKEYAYFYLKLMVESLAENGYLRSCHEIPYNIEMLAAITNTNVDVARVAMEVLTRMGMIETMDGIYYIAEVARITGKMVDSPEAIKKRRQRAEKAEQAARIAGTHADVLPALTSTEQGKQANETKCPDNVPTMSHDTGTNCPENIRSIEVKKNRSIEEEKNSNYSFDYNAPAREEVEAFIKDHCPHIARYKSGFYDYYDKRGWMIEGNPITDWRALAAKWDENMATECDKLPYEEERNLWKKYEKAFGKKVPCQFWGVKYKYVQLALATGKPLED